MTTSFADVGTTPPTQFAATSQLPPPGLTVVFQAIVLRRGRSSSLWKIGLKTE